MRLRDVSRNAGSRGKSCAKWLGSVYPTSGATAATLFCVTRRSISIGPELRRDKNRAPALQHEIIGLHARARSCRSSRTFGGATKKCWVTACTSRRQRWSAGSRQRPLFLPPPCTCNRQRWPRPPWHLSAAIRSSPRCSAVTGVPAWTISHTRVVSSTKRARAERAIAMASQTATCAVVPIGQGHAKRRLSSR